MRSLGKIVLTMVVMSGIGTGIAMLPEMALAQQRIIGGFPAAQGSKPPYEPQPYATLDVSDVMFKPVSVIPSDQWRNIVGEVAFDETRSLLYMAENMAYGDDYEQPLIHVWKVQATGNSYLLWTK